jgi:hypothetical protein
MLTKVKKMRLAIHTKAVVVYAADRIRWYSTFLRNGAQGRFDFGEWEGTIVIDSPDGSQPAPVGGAPVEFAVLWPAKC